MVFEPLLTASPRSVDTPGDPKTTGEYKQEPSGGFFKYFEEFLRKPWRKKQEDRSQSSRPADLTLSSAVRSLVQETSTTTAVIGSKGIGKSHLVNAILETTVPTEEEYTQQFNAALFAEKVHSSSPDQNTLLSSSPLLNSSVIHDSQTNVEKKYASSTTYAFGEEDTKSTPESYSFKSTSESEISCTEKPYNRHTEYSFDSVMSEVKDEIESESNLEVGSPYTTTTTYQFNEPNVSLVEDTEFQWDIGQIEQTLVPDPNYENTIDWSKETTNSRFIPDDMRPFVVPQFSSHSMNGPYPRAIEIRHGKIPELIVSFSEESKIRSELWELHEIELGSRKFHNQSHKLSLEARYRSILGLKKENKIPLGHVKSPGEFKLPETIQPLLGKAFRFRGLGYNFDLDRIYIRDKLREVMHNYGFFVSNIMMKVPSGILEGNRHIVDISGCDVPDTKCHQIVSNANLLLVVLDKRGITPDLVDLLRTTGFLEKALRNPEQHKAVFLYLTEATEPKAPAQLFDPLFKAEFDAYKHSVVLQYKLLLSEHASWANVDRIVASTTVLPIYPRLHTLLHTNTAIPDQYMANRTKVEALSATCIPALMGTITNVTISKCAEPLREMNNEWLNRAYPGSQVTQEEVKPLSSYNLPEQEEKGGDLSQVVDQFTASFQNKFDRFKLDLIDKIETMDMDLIPATRECEQHLNCKPLLQAAPEMWKQNIAAIVPSKIEEMLSSSSSMLDECLQIVEKSSDTTQKARLTSLLQFCQGTHERTIKYFEDFQRLVQSDTSNIVKAACVDAFHSRSKGIPEVAAKNIKQKFSEKLKTDLKSLDIMEKDLKRAMGVIMVALKSNKPNTKQPGRTAAADIPTSKLLNSKKLDNNFVEIAESYRKLHEEDMMITRYQAAKQTVVPTSKVYTVGVCTFDEVETPKYFTKNAWMDIDMKEPIVTNYQDQLDKAGLYAKIVKQDGNCQFRALAHQVYGTEDAYSIVRLLVMSEILSNPFHYERFLTNRNIQLQEYVSQMAKDKEKGDHLTLCAFSNFYGSDLLLYSPMFSQPLLIQSRQAHTNRIFRLGYIHEHCYQSLIGPEKLKRQSSSGKDNVQHDINRSKRKALVGTKHYELSGVSDDQIAEPKAKTAKVESSDTQTVPAPVRLFSPRSLVDLCISKVTQHIDMVPCLDGAVPEELVQKLLSSLIRVRKIDDSVFERVIDGSIRNLDMEGCTQLTDTACKHIARTCTSLTTLNLSGCTNISNEAVVQIALHCNELVSLNLSGCSTIGNIAIQELARNCPKLSFINLSGCSKVTDIAITELCLACPKLHTLILRDCNRLTDAGLEYISKTIAILDLVGCEQLTDTSALKIAERCERLTTLRLSSKNLTDDSITKIATSCRNLRVVEFNTCDLLTDISIKSLAENSTYLESLSLVGCHSISSEAFDSQVPLFPNLTQLDLSRCLNVTDAAVIAVTRDCENLEVINLSSCEDITDEAVLSVAARCKYLHTINLSKCIKITDNSVRELISQNAFTLRKLVLYNCHKITDGTVAHLALTCSQLRELDISSCQNITDQVIHTLVHNCPFLEGLSLEECRITEASINSIAACGYSLKTLKLAYCKGVTEESLLRLSKGCPHFEHLDLSYCTGVSLQALKFALTRWPLLRILSLRGWSQLTSEAAIEHPSLRELNLSWCKNLQDAALDHIATACPALVSLDIAWASKVSTNAVHKLAQRLSSLRVLNLRGCSKVALLTLKFLSHISIYN